MPSYEDLRSAQSASDFISGNLNTFYGPDESGADKTGRLAEEATARGIRATEELGLGPEFTPQLIKLAFYDFMIFCGRRPNYPLTHRASYSGS
jgi:hypothetical protein